MVSEQINMDMYKSLSRAIEKGLVASAQSIHRGGLAVALAKTAMGGLQGMDIYLPQVPNHTDRDDFTLYSESQGRIIVTVNPNYTKDFESLMSGNIVSKIGTVRDDKKFRIIGRNGDNVVDSEIPKMLESYKSTFRGY